MRPATRCSPRLMAILIGSEALPYIQVSPTSKSTTGSCAFTGSTSLMKASNVEVFTVAPGYSLLSLSSDICTSALFFGGPVLSVRNSVHSAKPLGDVSTVSRALR